VEKEIVLPLHSAQRYFLERYELINDAVAELAAWSCFDPNAEADDSFALEDDTFRKGDDLVQENLISMDCPTCVRRRKSAATTHVPAAAARKYKKCRGRGGKVRIPASLLPLAIPQG